MTQKKEGFEPINKLPQTVTNLQQNNYQMRVEKENQTKLDKNKKTQQSERLIDYGVFTNDLEGEEI